MRSTPEPHEEVKEMQIKVVNFDDNGRITSYGFSDTCVFVGGSNAARVDELPDGEPTDYVYKDGEVVYSPLPKAEEERSDT
jgi:hypothetical protein